MAKLNWKNYQRFGQHKGFYLFERVKGTSPIYAFRSISTDPVTIWGTTNFSKTDLKILAEESVLGGGFGPGILSGYAFRNDKPAQVYRGVKIGRYVLRSEATDLPKFGAHVVPPGKYSVSTDIFVVSRSLKEMQRKIDEAISGYPTASRRLFVRA